MSLYILMLYTVLYVFIHTHTQRHLWFASWTGLQKWQRGEQRLGWFTNLLYTLQQTSRKVNMALHHKAQAGAKKQLSCRNHRMRREQACSGKSSASENMSWHIHKRRLGISEVDFSFLATPQSSELIKMEMLQFPGVANKERSRKDFFVMSALKFQGEEQQDFH